MFPDKKACLITLLNPGSTECVVRVLCAMIYYAWMREVFGGFECVAHTTHIRVFHNYQTCNEEFKFIWWWSVSGVCFIETFPWVHILPRVLFEYLVLLNCEEPFVVTEVIVRVGGLSRPLYYVGSFAKSERHTPSVLSAGAL